MGISNVAKLPIRRDRVGDLSLSCEELFDLVLHRPIHEDVGEAALG